MRTASTAAGASAALGGFNGGRWAAGGYETGGMNISLETLQLAIHHRRTVVEKRSWRQKNEVLRV
jgi:hypothetical protein